jgi:hypothetical protein
MGSLVWRRYSALCSSRYVQSYTFLNGLNNTPDWLLLIVDQYRLLPHYNRLFSIIVEKHQLLDSFGGVEPEYYYGGSSPGGHVANNNTNNN